GAVDLVGPRVGEVFPLQVEVDAEPAGQLLRRIDRRRAADIVFQERVQPGAEFRVGLGVGEGVLNLLQDADQQLRDIPPAVGAEVARSGNGPFRRHHRTVAPFAAATKAAMRAECCTPLISTPELTSTPSGRTAAIAPATLSGRKPPARNMRGRSG